MKNTLIIFGVIAMSIVFAACNKDKRANNLLDANWVARTVNGGNFSTIDNVEIRIIPSGEKSGTAIVNQRNIPNGDVTEIYSATYSINNEKITFVTDMPGLEPIETYEIVKLKKNQLEWKNENGEISKFDRYRI